jgi:hypothetical protein
MYQVQCATEQFGPAGIGWGWEFELIFPPNDSILAKVTVWHGKKDQTVSQVGQKKLGGERIDEDAAKKAVTDGLTKCLSYLGFNADVFLGKFDDNKYVEAMKAEHNPTIKEFRTFKYKAEIDLGNIMDEKGLTTWVKANQKTIEDAKMNSDTKADAMALMATYSKVKAEVTPTP